MHKERCTVNENQYSCQCDQGAHGKLISFDFLPDDFHP
ncbi:hypothetical protein ACFV9I_01905 [Peribacillus muralis]